MNWCIRILRDKPNEFSLDVLKTIAIILMVIDHTVHIFWSEIIFLTAICRVVFPMFAFLIAYHLYHSQDLEKSSKNYIKSMAIYAVISQPFFSYAAQTCDLNVIFNLLCSVIFVYYYNYFPVYVRHFVLIASFFLSFLIDIKMDYSFVGMLLPFVYYGCLKNDKGMFFWLIWSLIFLNFPTIFPFMENITSINYNLWVCYMSFGGLASVFVIPLIIHFCWKGKRFLPQKFGYMFYPAHLALISVFIYITKHFFK